MSTGMKARSTPAADRVKASSNRPRLYNAIKLEENSVYMRYSMLILGAVCACALQAQPKGEPRSTWSPTSSNLYNRIKNNITAAADEMPDEGYTFQPTAGRAEFGGWVAHVADRAGQQLRSRHRQCRSNSAPDPRRPRPIWSRR